MMSEKRFTLIFDENDCPFFNDGDFTLSAKGVVDLLNSLNDENEQLRKENKDLNDIEWEKFKKKYHLE